MSINFVSNIFGYFYNYYSIFIFLCLSLLVSIFLYIFSVLLSVSIVEAEFEKISTYECGFVPFSESRMKFDINFYIISILFVIFDLEIVFLFPWSVSILNIGAFGFISMVYFFIILTVGFVFEWSKEALDL